MPETATPALIFDLDGTLVDTAPDLLAATNAVLAAERRPGVDPESLRHMVGHGARALIRQAFAATGLPVPDDDLPRLVDSFIAQYRRNIAGASRPFPGVPETLAALKAEGARLGVLTNKPQELTDLLLPVVGLDRFFGAVLGAGRLSFNKPDARTFEAVVKELGGRGAGAVMIGDSATDVATARNAGVEVILVGYGYTPEPARTLGADAVVEDFREIPVLIRRLLAYP